MLSTLKLSLDERFAKSRDSCRATRFERSISAVISRPVSRTSSGANWAGYTELLTESRRQALERMLGQAQQLGANAVVNVRFTTSAVTQGAAELYAYGTAVVID